MHPTLFGLIYDDDDDGFMLAEVAEYMYVYIGIHAYIILHRSCRVYVCVHAHIILH